MKYRLIGKNDFYNIPETILTNRELSDPKKYMKLTSDCLYNYAQLDNISEAVQLLLKHKENRIHIIVDCDVDGYTSAAILYMYIEKVLGRKCSYSLHTGKQHGISDDIEIPQYTNLVIVPDAGTNDDEQCKELKKKGIDVLILDHHEKEIDNPFAVIVNNQMCDYPNKDLCGVGIVYRFLQALDDELWENEADNYLDLVALGNISDVMDIRSYETKYLIEQGLQNIKNKMLVELIEQQSFSMVNRYIIDFQFYVTPILNALIRVGTEEEKTILFKALIGIESDTFSYKKRGETVETIENIYEHAVRLCKNAKASQGRLIDRQVPLICDNIERKGKQNNSLIICNVTDTLEPEFTGLAAIKVASKYEKPVILLRKTIDESGETIYSGSARNPNDSPIENLKDVINSLNCVEMAQGHQSAFGIRINKDNINELQARFEKYIKDNNIVIESVPKVDFEIDYDDFDISMLLNIAGMKPYYGSFIEEASIVIKNIPFSADQISVIGKDKSTWSIYFEDMGFKLIKFKCSSTDDILNWNKEYGVLTILGTCSINIYNGTKTPQIMVRDYEVI